LLPRLSAGTLQLSIRCSSIHFLPSRSFPVSVPGWIAEFGVGWPSDGACWATAENVRPDNARQSVKNATCEHWYVNRMDGLAYR